MGPGGGGGGGGGGASSSSSTEEEEEELRRLRAEVERLRAEQVLPPTLRGEEEEEEEASRWRRRVAAAVGREEEEPRESLLRKLAEARRGWQELLLARRAALLGPGEQEQLLGLLDLARALLDRIEAQGGREEEESGGGGGAPTRLEEKGAAAGASTWRGRRRPKEEEEEEMQQPSLPTPEETPLGEREEEDGEDYDEEEEEDDDEDEEEEEDCPPLDDIRQAVGVLEEEVLVHQEFTQEVALLEKRVKTLRRALNRSARGQMRRLDRLESRLHEALLCMAGRTPLEGVLRRVPREKVGRLQMFVWDFTDALWRFLQSDARQHLPAKMEAWRKEMDALVGKLYSLKVTPLSMQKKEMWTERLSTHRMHGFLRETWNLDSAAALLQEALMEVWQEEGVFHLQKMLVALRRGPLKEMSKMEKCQARLDAILAALLEKQGLPTEEEVLVVQRSFRGTVGIVNPMLLKEVVGLPVKVGVFLGVGGETSQEILAFLCIPLREVEALANSVDTVCEALFRITQSMPVEAPQRKVRAVSHRLGDLNRALRASGRQAVLQDGGAQEIPLEELANLSEKLWSLRDILRMRAAALKNGPLEEAEEVPEPELDPPTLSPAWGIRTPEAPRTSKAQEHIAAPVLTPMSTMGSSQRGSKAQKQCSKRVFHVTSSANIPVTPLHQKRPAPSSIETTSAPVAGQDPTAAVAQGPATFYPSHKRARGADDASTHLNVKGCLNGTDRLQRQDVQIPEELSDAGSSEDALSFCSQDGTSGPPSRRPRTEDPESTRRDILAQELFAAYKNYANYVTDALNEDREKMDHLVVELLHPSHPLSLLNEAEEAEAMAASLNGALLGHLKWLQGDL